MERKTLEHYFHLLGLEPGASLDDVKEAYRFLAQTFHPDKYLADHPFRERALKKMIEINIAYEQLKSFFTERPCGEPEGGWQTASNERDNEDPRGEGMDWQAWQHDQEVSWESELKEWQAQETERRANLKVEEEKKHRQLIVKVSRFGIVAAFLCLLIGHSGSHQMHEVSNGLNDSLLRDKLQYDLATHDTANGAYSMSNSQIYAQEMPGIVQQQRSSADESSKDSTSFLMLVALAGGIAWFFFSKKANKGVNNWVDNKTTANAKA